MSTSEQDKNTQTAASTGAQSNDATLAANAAQNQNFANQSRTTLFGTYNPVTNSYTGGTESGFLDPSSLDTNSLTGAYKNLYNTETNQTATGARDAVATSQANAQSHGQGATPTGFSEDQQRRAYQGMASTNGSNYSNLFNAQHNEAVDQYNNANSLLSTNSTGAANLSLTGNTNAANNYSNLYGTASQQKQSALGSILGAGATLGAAALGKGTGCWVAAEIFGGWNEPRTVLVRNWVFGAFSAHPIGRLVANLYLQFGERTARAMRKHSSLRWFFTHICSMALRQARRAQ